MNALTEPRAETTLSLRFEEARRQSGIITPDDPLLVDTTQASPLHRIARYRNGASFTILKAYLLVVCCTYVPLAIAAMVAPASLTVPGELVKLPFLQDWNIAFTFLVSFPCLISFLISDDAALNAAMLRVQQEGTLIIPPASALELRLRWEQRFRRMNRAAVIVGAIVGAVLIVFNYLAYSTPDVGFWVTIDGDPRNMPLAYTFLLCIGAVYGFLPMYVIRSIGMTIYLNDVVSHARFYMLPFHPDKCGGLRPIGHLGLRHQYLLTVLGMNVVFLVMVSIRYLNMPTSLFGLIAGVAAAYLMLGPVVFMGPLLSFRAGMLRTKQELLGEIAQRLRIELHRLRNQLPSGQLSREDEDLVDRLRKVGGVIDELPVWPFDAGTLRKFLTAYVVPVIGATSFPLIRTGWKWFMSWVSQYP